MRALRTLAIVAFAGACATALGVTLEVVDTSGATVALRAPARRIVSLAPNATELLFAAGAGDRIVGVLSPADWPPEAARLPRVGDAFALDLERIVALEPDLAVAWPYASPAQVERLRGMGIPVYVSNPRTPDAIADDIERLGALSGRAETAERAATAFRARLAALRARERGAPRIRVFYEIWNQPLYTIGGDHPITVAIDLCGGANVFAQQVLPAPQVSVEAVLAARPDVIVAGADAAVRPVWLDAWAAWRDLPAVMYGNLFVVDANLLHRAGPRFVDGAEQLCAALDQARARQRR